MKRIRIIENPDDSKAVSRNLSLEIYNELLKLNCDVEIVIIGRNDNLAHHKYLTVSNRVLSEDELSFRRRTIRKAIAGWPETAIIKHANKVGIIERDLAWINRDLSDKYATDDVIPIEIHEIDTSSLDSPPSYLSLLKSHLQVESIDGRQRYVLDIYSATSPTEDKIDMESEPVLTPGETHQFIGIIGSVLQKIQQREGNYETTHESEHTSVRPFVD
jgi:hypothetical protein